MGNGYGFHDAKIIAVENTEYDYDHRQKNPIRNSLSLVLDLVGIEKVQLYNYKIIKDCDLVGHWWMCDTLSFENNKYILTVTVEDAKDSRKEDTFIVKFDNAERIINMRSE